MQRWIPVLAVIFCVQLLVAGAMALRRDALATRLPNSPLVTVPLNSADRILIETRAAAGQPANAARVELRKTNGAWVVHSDFDMPADGAKLAQLLTELTSLRRGLPIGDTQSALARFKVGEDDFARRVTLSEHGKTLATLYFGESAGLRKTDARAGRDRAVYTVDLPIYALPTAAGSWFNGDLLQMPEGKMSEIDISNAHRDHLTLTRPIVAGKVAGPWQAPGKAADKTVDEAQVAVLTGAIGAVHVDQVLGTAPQADWQLNQPLLALTIKDTDGKAVTWSLSKPKSGDFDVLKSSARPWYFSLTAAQAKPFLDAGASGALLAHVKATAKGRQPANSPHAKAAMPPKVAGSRR